MIEARILALLLLIGRLAGIFYLQKTIKAQNKLLNVPVADDDDGEITSFRVTLHRLTWAVALGQLVPISMDAWAVFTGGKVPFWLGVAYAISNCTTALLAAILIWKIYQLADNPQGVEQLEREAVAKRKRNK